MNTLQLYGNLKDFTASGLGFPIYPKQLQLLSELFGEVCWTCTNARHRTATWTRHDLSYNIHLLHFGVCPRCGTTRTKQITTDPRCFATQGSYMVGQRGGSTLMGCVASLYAEHRMLTLSTSDGAWCSPQSYFNLATDTALAQLIVCTDNKNVSSFLETRNSLRSNAPWFRALDSVLLGLSAREYCSRKDYGFFSSYEQHGLRLEIVTADKVRMLRGNTAYFTLADTSNWMPEPDVVHVTLQHCLRTMYNECSKQVALNADTWNPCLLSYSARKNQHDFLLQQHFQHRFDLLDPKHIVEIVPTWVMNPTHNRAELLRGRDNEQSARDFGCVCVDDLEALLVFVHDHYKQ